MANGALHFRPCARAIAIGTKPSEATSADIGIGPTP